ncbi:hypothetical protein RFF05_13180 [Bengtsoniella intestinalis]|uniref:hypothetical protein n=1 Tax=Bengtsoniella intestinalis TaxID=3073143 RepID=UPI00391F4F99
MKIGILLNDLSRYKGTNLSEYQWTFGSGGENGVVEAAEAMKKVVPEELHYLYFGNEFCEYCIPNCTQLKRWLAICQHDGLEAVFVTPVVSDGGIGRVREAMDYLMGAGFQGAVVVNDLGVAHLLNTDYPSVPLIVGRLLDKLSHDPRGDESAMQAYYGETGMAYATTPSVECRYVRQALPQQMMRFEYDLPQVGFAVPENQQSRSLYWPYHYLTTGRVCLFRSMGLNSPEKFLVGDGDCQKTCQGLELELQRTQNPDQTLFQKGNTIFYVSNPSNIPAMLHGFDRVVFQIL